MQGGCCCVSVFNGMACNGSLSWTVGTHARLLRARDHVSHGKGMRRLSVLDSGCPGSGSRRCFPRKWCAARRPGRTATARWPTTSTRGRIPRIGCQPATRLPGQRCVMPCEHVRVCDRCFLLMFQERHYSPPIYRAPGFLVLFVWFDEL